MELYATCAGGFEQLLGAELSSLGLEGVRPLKGQVAFAGELTAGYTACLHSRIASRVVAVLGRVDTTNADALYESVSQIPWEDHLIAGNTLLVDAHGTNAELRNTHYAALRVKDAVSDRVGSRAGYRVATSTESPDLRLQLRVGKEHGSLGIDLSGEPLFRRAYGSGRAGGGDFAPLRADYASALLALGGWYRCVRRENPALIAVGSGAGALLVEAASQVLEIAPGLARTRWGFSGWAGHDAEAFERLVDKARAQAEVCAGRELKLYAFDTRAGFRGSARHALRAAGLACEVVFPDASGLAELDLTPNATLLAADLSWAAEETFGLSAELDELEEVAAVLDAQTPAALYAAPTELAALGLKDDVQAQISVHKGSDDFAMASFSAGSIERGLHACPLKRGGSVRLALPASDQFVARLEKVARTRAKWARREDVSCYRVYDADLPDYAVAIDLFCGLEPSERWLQISEYAAPAEVDPALAQQRLSDVLSAAPAVLEVDPRNTFLHVRSRAKGGSQYADASDARGGRDPRQGRDTSPVRAPKGKRGAPPKPSLRLGPNAHLVFEGGLTFEVNFSERLDCGLFLDTRDVRAQLRERAKHARDAQEIAYVDNFLNLFGYTGTASCYAADGGARHTTTVDLSRTYLEWARRNMERNGFSGPDHEFVQADVIGWIAEQRRTKNRWQLIYCDPPTFSNSARMRKRSFDIQRDHAELLIGVSRLLARGGVCVFVCNLRSFKPDVEALAKAGVSIEDITPQTIPEDFSRTPKIHHCYLVRRIR